MSVFWCDDTDSRVNGRTLRAFHTDPSYLSFRELVSLFVFGFRQSCSGICRGANSLLTNREVMEVRCEDVNHT